MLRKNDTAGNLEDGTVKTESQEVSLEATEKVDVSEDDRARRAILASVADGIKEEDLTIDEIPVSRDSYYPPMDETDAYKQDVLTRPNSVCTIPA